MGLDLVELVIDVEKSFGLHIADSEAAATRTVGDLYSLVLRAMPRRWSGVCQSGRLFYRVRNALMHSFDVPRGHIRPASQMSEFFPPDDHRRRWRQFAQRLDGLQVPELTHPCWRVIAATLCFLGAVIGLCMSCSGLFLTKSLSESRFLTTCIGGGLLLAGMCLCALPPSNISPKCRTIRALVEAMLRLNPARRIVPELTGQGVVVQVADRSGEVWRKLCQIISENLGVDADSLTPSTRFVEDLGAD